MDFCNEVYRSLAACDGVVLLVDANHGVQAQTVANYHLAKSKELAILPVLNKVDLKNADPDRVCMELLTLFNIDPDSVLRVSSEKDGWLVHCGLNWCSSLDIGQIWYRSGNGTAASH